MVKKETAEQVALEIVDVLDNPLHGLEESEKAVIVAMVAALMGPRMTEDQSRFAESMYAAVVTCPYYSPEKEKELRDANRTH